MRYIADLHVHSHYSRATSKNLTLESLYQWAKIKGIGVVGTGDFTHPFWFRELREKLAPDGGGFFRLKDPPPDPPGLRSGHRDVRFCLTSEISSIYKKDGKVRKNHNLVYAPDLDTVARINTRLAEIGNLEADGRPILGLPSRDLLEIVLHSSPRAYLVPAHIWTPWFSMLGSKSGYDSVAECFGDLTEYIFALETGLSSDPAMNWKLSSLDRFALISNSDAHSAEKLGREGNCFDAEFSYDGMFDAIRTRLGFLGTLEFFPEEGKYHLDGHRRCGVVLDPKITLEHNGLCPHCGEPLTIGVLHRVEALADREVPQRPDRAPEFEYLVPLPEILSELVGTGPGSKAVAEQYRLLLAAFGSEFALLREAPLDDVERRFGPVLAEALRRMRSGQVSAQAGYDGEYGVIRFFRPGEKEELGGQTGLFGKMATTPKRTTRRTEVKNKALTEIANALAAEPKPSENAELDPEQATAVLAEGSVQVNAGPGTGKTRTLTHWLLRQYQQGVSPDHILAVTFTRKAAEEVRNRLRTLLGAEADRACVGTFHAIAWEWLREREAAERLYDDAARQSVLRRILPEASATGVRQTSEALRLAWETDGAFTPELSELSSRYRAFAATQHAVDVADLVGQLLRRWENDPAWLESCRRRVRCCAVDEFQDINPQQYRLIQTLCTGIPVFAIGDPDQAIYAFRGSDANLFTCFADDFAAQRVALTRNYRSAPALVAAAQALIARNPRPARPALQAQRSGGEAVQGHAAADAAGEASFLVHRIRHLVGGLEHEAVAAARLVSFADIAVLFRVRTVGEALLPHFRQANIPVRFGDAMPLLAEPPFDAVAAALRLHVQAEDPVAWETLLPGLGWQPAQIRRFLSGIEDLGAALQPDAILPSESLRPVWERWVSTHHALPRVLQSQGVAGILQACLDLFAPPSGWTDDQRLHADTILELGARHGNDPAAFLRDAALTPNTDALLARAEAVRFLTFHAAKGLEFPIVLIAGVEEGITPWLRDADLAEERRLFYVALTRARDQLFVTHAAMRSKYGSIVAAQPSRFLQELPALMGWRNEPLRKAKLPCGEQLSLFST